MKNLLLILLIVCAIANAPAQVIQQRNGRPSSPNQNNPTGSSSLPTFARDTTNRSPNALTSPKVSADSIIRVGLILPFDAQNSADKLYSSMSDKEGAKNDNTGLREAQTEALDFYEGLRYALITSPSRQKISFYVFDSQNSDSLVQELAKDDSLKACDIIIGPTTPAQARTIATFCKKYKIINVQPFVASKSFSTENPYLVRFMPTIDAHLQKEYEMVIDSFSDANIIVYTTKRERDLSAARQLDTLFKSYNDINPHKLRYTFINSTDSTIPAPKRTLSTYILPKELNVVLMTCYDEPVVNSQLRTIKDNTIVFGMPTWIDAEQIRIDYLNKSEAYFTDNYYVDTTKSAVTDFIAGYSTACNQKPSRYSYLGYDAMRYLSVIFDKYGKGFSKGFDNESYDGLGFSFHISPMIHSSKASGEPVINYYANTAMHLFQVSDYKVWLIK